jgi:hypothetical protein
MQGESAATAGYANAAVAQPDEELAEAAIDAFANLASAIAVDCSFVATLTEANASLVKQLKESAQALKEVKSLLKKERSDRASRKPFAPFVDSYCWSNWYKLARNHTSINCLYPKTGHKKEATKSNNMGGSQALKEWLAGATSKNNSETFEDCRTPPLLQNHDTDIVDSGCTGHFLLINAPCRNKIKSKHPLRVRLPNGDTMDSSHTAALDILELSEAASVAHVLPAMANNSLLSVGQLCNKGYYVTFKLYGVTIFNSKGHAILKGVRDLGTGLWHINMRNEPQYQIASANNVYELRNTGV